MIPARLKQFIELIYERDAEAAFAGKYTSALSTSVHFNDHIAHRYIQGISGDLDMRFVASFSADMMDLLDEDERQRLIQFGDYFLSAVQNKYPTLKRYKPLVWREFQYLPVTSPCDIDVGSNKVLVISDAKPEHKNVQQMVDRFCASFSSEIEVINLWDLKIVSSCIGCLQCGFDNDCAFSERDEFVPFYLEKVLEADVLIYAGTMTDRFLSTLWKTYFDRSFFMGHIPSLMGTQLGFIISGPLSQNENLRDFFESYTGWQTANIIGFVTDEADSSEEIDTQLQSLARRGIDFAESGYLQPSTFLGVGGHKVLRDEVWGRLRTVFQADHRFYKDMGLYDFPMWDVPTHMMAAMGTVGMNIPKVREQFQEMLKHGVSFRHKKIVEKA
jgi:hypothetical protein